MANADTRLPDFTVKSSERYINEENRMRFRSSFIGVGWKNTHDSGEERINLKLHALPVNGELVLWDYQPPDTENRTAKDADKKKR